MVPLRHLNELPTPMPPEVLFRLSSLVPNVFALPDAQVLEPNIRRTIETAPIERLRVQCPGAFNVAADIIYPIEPSLSPPPVEYVAL